MFEASIYVAGAEASAPSAQQLTGNPVHPRLVRMRVPRKTTIGGDSSTKNVLSSSDAVHFFAGRTTPRLCLLGSYRHFGLHGCHCTSGWEQIQ
eukprot:1525086-Prymnesium_polylepis.2